MIRIEQDTLYTRADLAEMLEPAGVNVDHFIARLKPRKVFKMVWLGSDLLAALRTAPALVDREETGPAPKIENILPSPVPARPRAAGGEDRTPRRDPSAALKEARQKLKAAHP